MSQNPSADDALPLAFVTGASAGIGRALTVRLARDGWRVVASSRRQAVLESIGEEHPDIAARVYPRAADVTDADGFKRVYDAVESELGPVDTVVFNAGDYDPMTLDEFDPALFERLIRVNYLGAINGIAAALPAMRGRARGQILVTGSITAYCGLPKAAPYGASKAAIVNMVESLKPEVDRTGVRLRVINPGFVKTQLTDKNDFSMPQIVTPDHAADYIAREIAGTHFEIVFPKLFGRVMKLLSVLPYRLYFGITRRMLDS